MVIERARAATSEMQCGNSVIDPSINPELGGSGMNDYHFHPSQTPNLLERILSTSA